MTNNVMSIARYLAGASAVSCWEVFVDGRLVGELDASTRELALRAAKETYFGFRYAVAPSA